MGSIKTGKNRDGKISYHCEVRRKGYRPVYKSFARLTHAKRWIQSIEGNINTGHFVNQVEAGKHTLSEAIDRYIKEELPKKPKSEKEQRSQLEWFKKEAGYKVLSDISAAFLSEVKSRFLKEDISKKRTWRVKDTEAQKTPEPKYRSGQTWNRYQSILSCVFQMCIGEWQWMEYNPARRIKREKENPGRVRFLTDDERDKLLKACREVDAENLYTAVVLALSTGMRKAEVRNLTWHSVDLQKGVIILHDTKNKERRRVPLRGKALELLKQHSKIRRIDTDFVFPGPLSTKTKSGFHLENYWREALAKAGLKGDFRFHDLRHSCASYLAMDGASLLEIAEILGHKTLQMVKRYSHLAESHTADVLERMNRKRIGG